MGWESSTDTFSELRLNSHQKEKAINYAKKRKKLNLRLLNQKKEKQ